MDSGENKNQYMRFPKWITIILILSLLLNFVMFLNINSLKQDIANLHNNINSISSTVNSSMSNNMSQINQMLKKETSLVTEFKYEMDEYRNKRADFLLNLKLKSFKKGEKVFFACKTGNDITKLIEAKSIDDINFIAKVDMSIFDSMDIDLVIEDGIEKKTEKLDSIYRPVEKLAAQVQPRGLGGSMRYDKKKGAIITTYDFELLDHQGGMKEYKLSDVQLNVMVNDKVIDTKIMPKDNRMNNNRYYINLEDYEIPSKTGDSVKIYILAKDDKGFNYKSFVQGWKINEDGSFEDNTIQMDFGRVDIS